MSVLPDRIEVRICSPHQPIRLISARLSGQIKSLGTLWPSKRIFIFNGFELLEEKTFEFYGIRTGDSIIALPINLHGLDYCASQWMKLTSDSESFNDHMTWMLDPNTSGEAARLRDLHVMRIERILRGFSKLGKAQFLECETLSTPGETKVDYKRQEKPNTEALPVCWD